MRIYKITADCLVMDCLCTWYVKARTEREAWLKGYDLAYHSPVADCGTIDCIRVKDFRKEFEAWDVEKKPILTAQ